MLKASDLVQVSKIKKSKDKETYKEFLKDCYTRIKSRNEKGATHCIYTVPLFAMGKALYSADKALDYIIRKLEKGDFQVQPLRGTTIYISWLKSHSKDKYLPLPSNSKDNSVKSRSSR